VIFVVGGGVIGAAVARVAARTGPVLVGSRTPRAHAGLWLRFDITNDPLPPLPERARIVLALGDANPSLVLPFARRAQRPVVVIGRGGQAPLPGAVLLRCSPAWDLHERSLSPVVDAMRQGHAGKLPRALPVRHWIWAEDLARVALAPDVADVDLRGPVPLDGAGVAAALVARERGACGFAWSRGKPIPPDPDRDGWDDTRWGARRRL